MFAIFLKTLAIFLMIFAGYLVRRLRMVDEAFNRQLSLLLINVFYPALILSSVVRSYTLEALAANWTLPAGCALIMAGGWAVGRLAQPWLHRQPEELRRVFHFQCTVNNYSFLPIMLVAGLLGERAVAQVVLASFGAEICLWTLGVQALTGQGVSWRAYRNLLTMPMGALVAAVTVLACRALLARTGADPAQAPGALRLTGTTLLGTCQMIGQATIPVSAVICGSRMATLQAGHVFSRLMLGMVALRLAAIPALAMALLFFLPLTADAKQVLAVIAVQPVSMASVTLSEIYRTDARFAAAAVLATHVACLVTVPLWLHFML